MYTKEAADKAFQWHFRNGGHFTVPSGHALKILEEAFELCFACGASTNDVANVLANEVYKATKKNEITGNFNPDAAKEELADVSILMAIMAYYLNTDMTTEVDKKIPVLHGRKWGVNKAGVVKRPDRV